MNRLRPSIEGCSLDYCRAADLRGKLLQLLARDLRMGDLATAEAHGHLDLAALFQKFDTAWRTLVSRSCSPVRGRKRISLISMTFCALRASRSFFCLSYWILAEIEKAADRRHGIRRDLDQIQVALVCQTQGIMDRQDAELVAFFVDDPHLAHPNLLVDAGSLVQLQ